MSGQWTAPIWLLLAVGLLLLALLVATIAALRAVRRGRRAAAAETAALERRLDDLERRAATPTEPAAANAESGRPPYVITRLGDQLDPVPDPEPVPTVSTGVFADLVLREGVIRSASLLHGVRRALAPEVRHRIRGEVRREVKRARRARRVEQREALRDWRSRQRSSESAA